MCVLADGDCPDNKPVCLSRGCGSATRAGLGFCMVRLPGSDSALLHCLLEMRSQWAGLLVTASPPPYVAALLLQARKVDSPPPPRPSPNLSPRPRPPPSSKVRGRQLRAGRTLENLRPCNNNPSGVI
jgi:hypothetical protein